LADYIRAVPTIDLPDDELAVTAAIRGVIEGDKYPHAPRLDPLRAALARLQAASKPPLAGSGPELEILTGAGKVATPKARPPAKADKRARR
jgi:hypothetical protein